MGSSLQSVCYRPACVLSEYELRGTSHSGSAVCLPSKVLRQRVPTVPLKYERGLLRTMILMPGVARELSEDTDAVIPRSLCSSLVDPVLHGKQKSLTRGEKGGNQPRTCLVRGNKRFECKKWLSGICFCCVFLAKRARVVIMNTNVLV